MMKHKLAIGVVTGAILAASVYAGTDLGNGGDGVVQYAMDKKTELFVYTYDLVAGGKTDRPDMQRIADHETVVSEDFKKQIRRVLQDTLLPADTDRILTSPCYETNRGTCSPTPTTIDRADRLYYEAMADAIAYHWSFISESHPGLVQKMLEQIGKFRFRISSIPLPANGDAERNVATQNKMLRDLYSQERVGCARRQPSNLLEWSQRCLGGHAPLSHTAALWTHEALYAIFIDELGNLPGPSTSAEVRNYVNSIFKMNEPDNKLASDELRYIESIILKRKE